LMKSPTVCCLKIIISVRFLGRLDLKYGVRLGLALVIQVLITLVGNCQEAPNDWRLQNI
jgi:hypothetical protein